jgi:hypothetical protein
MQPNLSSSPYFIVPRDLISCMPYSYIAETKDTIFASIFDAGCSLEIHTLHLVYFSQNCDWSIRDSVVD